MADRELRADIALNGIGNVNSQVRDLFKCCIYPAQKISTGFRVS